MTIEYETATGWNKTSWNITFGVLRDLYIKNNPAKISTKYKIKEIIFIIFHA